MLPLSGLNLFPSNSEGGLSDLFSSEGTGDNGLFFQLFGEYFSSDSMNSPFDGELPSSLLEMLQGLIGEGNELPLLNTNLPANGNISDYLKTLLGQISSLDSTPGQMSMTALASQIQQQLSNDSGAQPALTQLQQDLLKEQLQSFLNSGNLKPSENTALLDFSALGNSSNSSQFLNNLNQILNSDGRSQSLEVPVRVGDPGWDKSLSNKILMLLNKDQQTVDIKLNPAKLGPMEVKLALNQDQASVTFYSSHALVREAVEQALPRLREMLAQHDIQLGDANVKDQQSFSAEGETESGNEETVHENNDGLIGQNDGINSSEASTQTLAVNSLLDTYA